MIRETFAVAAIVLVCSTAAAAPLATYESPCECANLETTIGLINGSLCDPRCQEVVR